MQPIVLDHLAFGLPDAAAVAGFVARLGAEPKSSGPGGNAFLWWQWEFAGGAALEMLEPTGPPDGFLHRFLAARGAGPHHLTFKVPSVREAIARAEARGYRPVGFDDSDPGWIEAFLHPKQAQGIVVQLAEEHDEVYAEGGGGTWERPPFPSLPELGPTARARLLGVLLHSHSEERARLQWGELLGGAETRTGRGLRFSWPDSPLRVDVVIDAGAPEGPVSLELAADVPLDLPEGPHPLFGLPWVQRKEDG